MYAPLAHPLLRRCYWRVLADFKAQYSAFALALDGEDDPMGIVPELR